MPLTQEDIDRVMASTTARMQQRQEPKVTLKVTAIVIGVIGVLAFFWFNAVSSLPFLYTPGWHVRVEKHIDKADGAIQEFSVIKANQEATTRTLERVERTQERQADDIAAIRKTITDYLARQAERRPSP